MKKFIRRFPLTYLFKVFYRGKIKKNRTFEFLIIILSVCICKIKNPSDEKLLTGFGIQTYRGESL